VVDAVLLPAFEEALFGAVVGDPCQHVNKRRATSRISACGWPDGALFGELCLLALKRECQAGNDEGQEKDRQDALSPASEAGDFALGDVEGLGSARVSAIADSQGVTSGFDRNFDGLVQFESPGMRPVDHGVVRAAAISTPMVLCVSFSVADIVDLLQFPEKASR